MVWPEGDGHSVEDGGNEWFGVGGFLELIYVAFQILCNNPPVTASL